MHDASTLTLIAEYMEKGFLENIIDMFRHDTSLYDHLPGLMSDARSRVRIGTVALVESLLAEHPAEIASCITPLAALLAHEEPVIRGDAVYLLGVIGHPAALPFLSAAADDPSEAVRQEVMETIEALKKGS